MPDAHDLREMLNERNRAAVDLAFAVEFVTRQHPTIRALFAEQIESYAAAERAVQKRDDEDRTRMRR